MPRRYVFFVWLSDTKRSSNSFDSFLTPVGDAERGKLQVKLVVAAWHIGIGATTVRKSRASRIISFSCRRLHGVRVELFSWTKKVIEHEMPELNSF